MIYLNNNTEVQDIFIPKQEITAPANPKPTYENGFEDGREVGFNEGREYQKKQLLNLYVTENGQYEREDGWGVVTVDVPTEGGGDCSEAYDKGFEDGYNQGQAECPEGGGCNLGEGEIFLTTNDAGTYELYASDDGYDGWSKFIVTLVGGGAIKVHKASDLLDTFNNGGNIDYGAYYYVGGEITEIQEVNTQDGNATYVLDNGLKIYRGKWFDGDGFSREDQIKVGAYIVVYGIIQDYRGELQFKAGSQVIAYQECEGGEIVSCNLEDKWVTPSMDERDGNGLIVVSPSEGYDGLSRTVIDPQTIYNEGVSAGKAEGSDLIIGTGDIYLTANERGQRFEVLPSEFEYDAFDKFIVELENFDLGGDANIYEASMVNDLLMGGYISYGNRYIFKGQITEIQRIRPEYGDARYTLDGSLNVYNGQTMGYDLQVGDNVIVIGTLSEYNGAPQFSAGSKIKAWWREGGSGNCDDAYNNGYNDGYNEGQANCGGGSANLLNPIIFSETEGDTINAESVQIPTFVYEGNQHYNVWALYMADYEDFKVQLRFQPTNGGYEEPVNIFGCEDTDWDNTTFGARIYQGQIYFRMSGDDVAYPYTEPAWYDVEMGYNSSKRWIIVNGETILEADHAFVNKPSQNFMIGAINSGGNAFRPFYGRIAAIYLEANGHQVWLLPKEEGHMDVYWNDRGLPWIAISGENNARFEKEFISGDGMKSITWLGKRVICPSVQEQAFEYDTTAFTYNVYDWTSANINRDNITNDCGDRPLDCLLLRNRNGECTVMTKFDNCSGTVRLESGWNGDNIILSLKSNTITKFSNSSIDSYHLKSIDTGFAQLEENAIINCIALTDIKVTILNNDLSYQFATNCFNGLPTEGTITINKNVGVTLTDDEITSFFRTIVGEGWTITIE